MVCLWILVNLSIVSCEDITKLSHQRFQRIPTMTLFAKVKKFSQATTNRLRCNLTESGLKYLWINYTLNWEWTFFCDCTLFFTILSYKIIKAWEELPYINNNKLISISSNLLLKLLLIVMKLLEIGNNLVTRTYMVNLLEDTQIIY